MRQQVDLQKKKNRLIYDRIKFSMQLYSQPSLELRDENKDINRPATLPDEFDHAYEKYKETKPHKIFRIDTHKHSQTSPYIPDIKLLGRMSDTRTSKVSTTNRLQNKESSGMLAC